MPKVEATTQEPIEVLATETLFGDIRDFILDRLKHEHNPLPWQMRPEAEQREVVSQSEAACRRLIQKAVMMIAAEGQKAIRGSLVKVMVKDGLKTQIDIAASDPLRHDLIDRVGSTVLVVIADTEPFDGERAPVKIIPDQSSILDEADE